MLVRSLIALLLSIPAGVALLGLIVAVTPLSNSQLPLVLLMIFPVWLGLACYGYLVGEPRRAALGLVMIAAVGFGLIALLKTLGLSNV